MKRVADILQFIGTDCGGMYVEVNGRSDTGSFISRRWSLVAEHGDGPWIPVIPAFIATSKLRDKQITQTGAFPCMGIFTLQEFESRLSAFRIVTEITDKHV